MEISTNLIQLDVVVTDKKGNQVTDLEPEGFEIFVNDKKQDITNFSYIFSNSQDSSNSSENSSRKKINKHSVVE